MIALDRLNAFLAVARELSFSRAAIRLGVPPSRVSREVANLERTLGLRLLERTTRSVRLTAEGRDLVDRSEGAVETLREVLGSRPAKGGVIRATAPPLAARTRIGPALIEFMQRRPDCRVDLVATNRLLDFIGDGIDIAFRLGPVAEPDLIVRKLWPVQYGVCASPGFVARHGLGPEVPLSVAEALPCISTGQAWAFEGAPRFEPVKIACVIDDLELAAQAVKGGLGLACLPLDLARTCGTLLDLEGLQPVARSMNAVYPSRRFLPARVRDLIDHIAGGDSAEAA